jgi:pterin-4a-carbinolamine dehydratase
MGAGALAIVRANAVSGRERDPNVFAGQETFERLVTLARERAWRARPIGERIGAIGMALRQTPYVVATLELDEEREVCSVDLRGLDCVTFFEISLAFARMLRRRERTPEALLAEVAFTRFRDGRLTDYASRLHYLSDWFFDNDRKRVVRLITRELPGAMRFTKRINFMSAHPEAYRQLRANPDLAQKIARVEIEINARDIQYVPREQVAAAQPLLKTGDIVGVTTSIDGLDCSHAGLCYRDASGVLRLLHGSTTQKAVILDAELATYLGRVSTHTGIMVARPLEVA